MARRYHEVVIEGARGRSYGFVEGFLVARGMPGPIYDMEKEGFDCQPLRERVGELLYPSEQTYHMLVPEEQLPMVRQAAEEARARQLAVEIHHERPVGGARFGFRFRIYSPKHAAHIRAWFDAPPEGASLSDDSKFEEIVRPDAKGLEAYAPDHEYELRAEGAVVGAVDGVLSLYHRCRDEELVQLESLELLLPETI